MRVAKNAIVTLRQRVTDPEGRVIDEGAEPITYLHGGYGDIFAKLEEALEGKEAGDAIRVTLAPADTVGEVDPALIEMADPDEFGTPPQPGDLVEREAGGETRIYRVSEIADGRVVVDANHPLAGLTLDFAATIAAIRPATTEEIAVKTKAETPPALASVAVGPSTVRGPWGLRYAIHSQTHKLFWQAPMFILPGIAALLYSLGHEDGFYAVMAAWLGWCFLGAPVIGTAIRLWGDKFLFFDFSPNLRPTALERRIATIGQVGPVLAGLLAIVGGLAMGGFSDVVGVLGAGVAIALLLVIPGAFVIPFLVIVLTGFRVRPVVDGSGE